MELPMHSTASNRSLTFWLSFCIGSQSQSTCAPLAGVLSRWSIMAAEMSAPSGPHAHLRQGDRVQPGPQAASRRTRRDTRDQLPQKRLRPRRPAACAGYGVIVDAISS